MLTTIKEIKAELADSFDWLTEDNLTEYVDGYVPIYTNEIIDEWTEMPNDYDDTWRELGLSANATITDRMSGDLYNYYSGLVQEAYAELVAENEEEED